MTDEQRESNEVEKMTTSTYERGEDGNLHETSHGRDTDDTDEPREGDLPPWLTDHPF